MPDVVAAGGLATGAKALMRRPDARLGYDVKYTDRPRLSKSAHLALEHLRLDRLTVVIPGAADYPLGDRIHVRGLETLIGGADPGPRLRGGDD